MEVKPEARFPRAALPFLVTGVLFTAEGGIAFTILKVWNAWSVVPIFAGLFFLLATGVLARRFLFQSLGSRRGKVGTNVAVMIFLALALWGIANVIGTRNYWLHDLTPSGKFTISDQTLSLLKDLEAKGTTVRVTTLHLSGDSLFIDVRDLLDIYAVRSKAIELEHIPVDREPEKHRIFLDRFEDPPMESSCIAFESGDRKKIVTGEELVEFPDTSGGRPRPGQEPRFRGEEAITSALLSVTEARKMKVLFTTGHQEAEIDGREASALALLARELRLKNLDVERLELPTAESIPDGTDLVIIARPNPAIPFDGRELHLLDESIASGVKLLVLLEPLTPSQLERGPTEELVDWLARYGARLPRGEMILDPPASLRRHPITFLATNYGDHEITRNLAGLLLSVQMVRPVDPAPENPEGFVPTVLVSCTKDGWAETDFGDESFRNPTRAVDTERGGPLPFALALEKEGDPGSRIVVIGDADPATNSGLSLYPNKIFIMNCVSWLLEREALVAVPSRPLALRERMELHPKDRRAVFWVTVIGMPLLALAMGLSVWIQRRK